MIASAAVDAMSVCFLALCALAAVAGFGWRSSTPRAGAALVATTVGELEAVTHGMPPWPPVRLRLHELAAGFVLRAFEPTAIRIVGLCLVGNALVAGRFRTLPVGFAAGVLVPVSLPAALVLLAWERAPFPFPFPPGPVLR
jgi:hypothetical protein